MNTSRARLYIDGFNFYYAIKNFCGRDNLYLGWCDFEKLFHDHLLPGAELVEIKYFTAEVAGHEIEEDERDRQALWLRAVATNPKVQRIDGFYKRDSNAIRKGAPPSWPTKCHDCPIKAKERVEKETDVNIAVQMIRDAALFHDFDHAVLISSDRDLRPAAFEFAQWPTRTLFASVWFPPGDAPLPNPRKCPPRLSYHRISAQMLVSSRLQDTIDTTTGPIQALDDWKHR